MKACGADVAKFQWASDGVKMAARRGLPGSGEMYVKYLQYDLAWLKLLKSECDRVGIEFMCTVYLPEDIPVIAPLVKRFKISAHESQWDRFLDAHQTYNRPIIVSINPGQRPADGKSVSNLHCISEYPAPLEHMQLVRSGLSEYDGSCFGLSDHSGNVLTGAVAVARGAKIIESHVRLQDTPEDNPDYGHSLSVTLSCSCRDWECGHDQSPYEQYVSNVRLAERML